MSANDLNEAMDATILEESVVDRADLKSAHSLNIVEI